MRSFEPCLCGDPECGRCFPKAFEIPCNCCKGKPDECKCEWDEYAIVDPDGNPTGAYSEYCTAHPIFRADA